MKREDRKDTPVTYISELEEAVASREIEKALTIVGDRFGILPTISLEEEHAYALLAYTAWAIDFNRSYLNEVEKVLPRFREKPDRFLKLDELAYLNIAQGLVNLHREKYDEAMAHFESARTDANRGENTELMTITRYYLGSCFWKKLDYSEGLSLIRDSKSRDLASKHYRRAAATGLVEAWLLFLIGSIKEAKDVLEHSKRELEGTDSFADYANAISFDGRLARQFGDNERALKSFHEAIAWYEKRDPCHRNIGRSHTNIAFIYRLMARDLDDSPCPQNKRGSTKREEVEALQKLSFEHLGKAEEIYAMNAQMPSRGLGKVHSLRALLYFDASKFDKADEEAREAYSIGNRLNDHLVQADARNIQSAIALEIGDALSARVFAEDAIEHASQTEHRRVKARAYIRLGFALLDESMMDVVRAQRLSCAASDCLSREDKDFIRQTLNRLKREIHLRSGGLPEISIRMTGVKGRTLKQITRKFKEEVVRRKYLETGCNMNETRKALRCNLQLIKDAIATYLITSDTIAKLGSEGVPQEVLKKLYCLSNQEITGREEFLEALENTFDGEVPYKQRLLVAKHAEKR
jgi:tetratricopeptide (TPR) repeat protein